MRSSVRRGNEMVTGLLWSLFFLVVFAGESLFSNSRSGSGSGGSSCCASACIPPVDKQQNESITQRFPNLGPIKPGQLIFEENFNRLDLNKWQPIITMSGCGSGEFQIYDKHPENVFVKDGILHIQPTLTADRYGEEFLRNGNLFLKDCTDASYSGCNKTAGDGVILNPVISARLRTLRSFSFLYGRVEVRAKIPAGDWIWPAIWMNPTYQKYGSWPISGEVDIMESRGNRLLYDEKTGVNIGSQQVSSCLHFGPTRGQDKWRKTFTSRNLLQGFDKDFHLYQFLWTPDEISFGVDNEITKTIHPPANGGMFKFGGFEGENPWENGTNPVMAPFDQFFYFLINVAVGGQRGYFNEISRNIPYNKPWRNSDTLEKAMADFWEAKSDWYPTWNQTDFITGSSSAFQIDYIRVWAL